MCGAAVLVLRACLQLCRSGVYAPEFRMNVTVGPGTYRVGLRFAERRAGDDPSRRAMNVSINGRTVAEGLDVAARAGGDGKALDLTFEDIRPQDGVIEIRLAGTDGGEAMVQAVEVARVSAVGARGSEK